MTFTPPPDGANNYLVWCTSNGDARDDGKLISTHTRQEAAERYAAVENFEPWQELTPREKQAAALACLGYTNLEIAERMVISRNTVKTHLRSVLRKFNVNSKSQLREVLTGWDFRGWIDGQDLWPDAGFNVSTPG